MEKNKLKGIVLGTVLLSSSPMIHSHEYGFTDYYQEFAKEVEKYGHPMATLPDSDYITTILETETFDGREINVSYTDKKPFNNFGEKDILRIMGNNINILDKGLDGEFGSFEEEFNHSGKQAYKMFPSHQSYSENMIEVKSSLVTLMSKIKLKK